MAVHFIKNSMLRSQISSGVRDELLGLSQRWCLFAEARAVHAGAGRASLRRPSGPHLGSSSSSSSSAAAAAAGDGERRGSKRLSLKQIADTGVVSELQGGTGFSSCSSAEGAGPAVGEASASMLAAAAVHKTTELHLLIALAVLVVVLAAQGLYSRSLTLQLRDVASALAALKAVVEEQAAALEELDAL